MYTPNILQSISYNIEETQLKSGLYKGVNKDPTGRGQQKYVIAMCPDLLDRNIQVADEDPHAHQEDN